MISKHSGGGQTAQNALPPGTTAASTRTAPAVASMAATATPTAIVPPPSGPRGVVVRLVPAAPSRVCVDDARRTILFRGTLAAPASYTGRHLRVNIARTGVRMTVNGRSFPVTHSPSSFGVNVHQVTLLAGGRPPCA